MIFDEKIIVLRTVAQASCVSPLAAAFKVPEYAFLPEYAFPQLSMASVKFLVK